MPSVLVIFSPFFVCFHFSIEHFFVCAVSVPSLIQYPSIVVFLVASLLETTVL